VFANSRRIAERLTQNLNDIITEHDDAAPEQVNAPTRAHHGSVSKEQRAEIEEALKAGQLKAVVATSSLELGIDMGAVDLVVQVEAPPSVASGLQRVGRAGHQVGAVSRGVFFPKFRGDLLASTVVVERMRAGLIEHLQTPSNPLDVLAQQIVAVVAMEDISTDDLFALMRKSAPFTDLPRSAFDAVLDLLSGRYSQDEFAELRPRLVWDRDRDVLTARSGTQRLAVTNGGTIPDRGLFPVLMVGERNTRVGELDEEMVYESREGDVFALGTSTWRSEDITHDAVYVSPAPGQAGKLPFWKGDMLGRPLELGRAIGQFVRELAVMESEAARTRLSDAGLDTYAQDNLISYLQEQQASTGVIPTDTHLVLERSRDELGDWRIILHSPFGAAVHAPWALIAAARFTQRFGFDPQISHADDGIVMRIPDYQDDFDPADLLQCLLVDPEDVETELTALVGGSALFAARFRECAARSLLLPKRDPRRRAPLWQQRQRAAALLSIASKYSTFPVLLETMREVMQDVYDLPGLRWLMQSLRDGHIAVSGVHTDTASPFSRSLLFDYIAQYLYEGDNPLAERRAAALTLDAELLTELLGTPDLRDLLDASVVASVHADLQRLSPARKAQNIDHVADLFRTLGPLTAQAALDRGATGQWLDALLAQRRLIEVRIGGAEHLAAIEDGGRLRDGLGVALPVGIPHAFTDVVPQPLHDLIGRWARTRGPFTVREAAEAFGLGIASVELVADWCVDSRRWQRGQFTTEHVDVQFCDTDVLRMLRRRAVAALRKQAEPVEPRAYARFLPQWHGCVGARRGMSGLIQTLEQLQGYPIALSTLESSVLPNRVADYQPAWLDELLVSGELTWLGRGALPGDDGWISLVPTGTQLLPPASAVEVPNGPLHRALLAVLDAGGAWLFRDLAAAVAAAEVRTTERELGTALWELVWSGQVSSDSFTPVRALLHSRRTPTRGSTPRPRLTGPRMATQAALPLRLSGRWHRCPTHAGDSTATLTRAADVLLARHGVVTGAAVNSERLSVGWSGMFPVLSAMEERGRARRGYIIEGLGGSQFSTASTIDVLRTHSDTATTSESAAYTLNSVVLAATDAANPFGAALPWPAHASAAHRPGRKVGASIVMVDGELVLFVERGGKTMLAFSSNADHLDAAITSLVDARRMRLIPELKIETIDGVDVCGPVDATTDAGYVAMALESRGVLRSPRGLVLR
jgi:ATP-dependent Lhr-like helicase